MILVGNKCDCEDQRQVSREEAVEFAREHSMGFVETSAWYNVRVDELFEEVKRQISATQPPQEQEKKKKKLLRWIKN